MKYKLTATFTCEEELSGDEVENLRALVQDSLDEFGVYKLKIQIEEGRF